MTWNWQQPEWPNFSYDKRQLEDLEARFLYDSGLLFGVFKHLSEQAKSQLTIELISNEALKTSEIEGEYLNRESLQSSIRHQCSCRWSLALQMTPKYTLRRRLQPKRPRKWSVF